MQAKLIKFLIFWIKEGSTEVKIKVLDKDSELVFKLKNKRYIDRKSINTLKNLDILTTIH